MFYTSIRLYRTTTLHLHHQENNIKLHVTNIIYKVTFIQVCVSVCVLLYVMNVTSVLHILCVCACVQYSYVIQQRKDKTLIKYELTSDHITLQLTITVSSSLREIHNNIIYYFNFLITQVTVATASTLKYNKCRFCCMQAMKS